MFKKKSERIKTKTYWVTKLKSLLYQELKNYLDHNNKTQSQFAEELGVSKGYISQVMNGDYDHKYSKLVELSLAIGKAPVIEFKEISEIENSLTNSSGNILLHPSAGSIVANKPLDYSEEYNQRAGKIIA